MRAGIQSPALRSGGLGAQSRNETARSSEREPGRQASFGAGQRRARIRRQRRHARPEGVRRAQRRAVQRKQALAAQHALQRTRLSPTADHRARHSH